MKVLLVEDDPEKARRVVEFLTNDFSGADVHQVRSFGPALDALLDEVPPFDLMLLDMSMPNFESSLFEPDGGPSESYAGKDLLGQMKLRGIFVPTIVVTMFDTFGERDERVSISDLASDLKTEFPSLFKGLVYYNQAQTEWKKSLRTLISKASQ